MNNKLDKQMDAVKTDYEAAEKTAEWRAVLAAYTLMTDEQAAKFLKIVGKPQYDAAQITQLAIAVIDGADTKSMNSERAAGEMAMLRKQQYAIGQISEQCERILALLAAVKPSEDAAAQTAPADAVAAPKETMTEPEPVTASMPEEAQAPAEQAEAAPKPDIVYNGFVISQKPEKKPSIFQKLSKKLLADNLKGEAEDDALVSTKGEQLLQIMRSADFTAEQLTEIAAAAQAGVPMRLVKMLADKKQQPQKMRIMWTGIANLMKEGEAI